MKKKALSLALALVMCLGLSVPAFAAEVKADDTSITVVDSTGLSITLKLSNSILGTETLAVGDGDETNVTAYTVPAGTTITPSIPGASWKEGIFNGDMLRNPDFVGTLPAGQTWDGEEGVEFACKKQTGAAGSWTDGDYFSESTTLSDGVLVIVCQHYFGVQDSDGIGTARESSRVYFQAADETSKSETAMPTNDKLTVDNNPANPTVYKIGGSNYFKIRDVAALLNGTEKQFDVGYDNEKKSVTVTTGQSYAKQDTDLAGAATDGNQTAAASNDVIYVDGQKIEAEVYKIGGSNYFKLRDLGKALNFYVGWTQERGMYIETDKPYSE